MVTPIPLRFEDTKGRNHPRVAHCRLSCVSELVVRSLVGLIVATLALSSCGAFTGAPPTINVQASGASDAAELELPAASPTSAGCGDLESSELVEGTSEQIVTYDQVPRRYLLHIPDDYRVGTPTSVVVTMHGLASNATEQMYLTDIARNADLNDYIVIAPEATDGVWSLPSADGGPVTSRDIGYIDAVIADVGSRLCIDPARVYASGMSMGSAMALALACAPERRFAAFGGVGFAFYRAVCDPTPPAPLIYFHGTADPIVPFEGGLIRGAPTSTTLTVMGDWAQHNGCTAPPVTTEIADVELTEWTSCRQGADVDFYQINGGGHTWPGAPEFVADYLADRFGYTTDTVDATELMWDFFSRHTLPSG